MSQVDDTGAAPSAAGQGTELLKSLAYGLGALFATFETITIHSALGGRLASGALIGLLAAGAAVLVILSRIQTPMDRRRILARVLVAGSAVGVVSAIVLSGRVAEFQGIEPTAGGLVQTVLFLVFQLGWAVTHWLAVEKGRTDQSRYVPAAIGGVLLIGGGFMTGGSNATRSVEEASPAAVFKRFATSEDFSFATETQRVGEEGGSVFAHYHSGRQPLIGVSFNTKDWFGRQRISDLEGVFDHGDSSEGLHTIEARPGYVVSAVEVQADDHINAIRVEFAPFDGTFLMADDWYWSEWWGSYERNGPATRLDGGTDLIVGLRGASGMVLNSLSLLTAPPKG